MNLDIHWRKNLKGFDTLFLKGNTSIKLKHLDNEPKEINRLIIENKQLKLELLPSKGLSVGQMWVEGKAVFWDSPAPLFDPDMLDLNEKLYINRQPADGFLFLKTYNAGIELLGLTNWGMPVNDPQSGKLLLLHGETHILPVEDLKAEITDEEIVITASFTYRTFEGNAALPWHQRGNKLFKVTRKILLLSNNFGITVEDSIENISDVELTPDWGYHITFRPEEGAKYMVPSQKKHERSFAPLPKDIETWHPAPEESQRIETGIIHQELLTKKEVFENIPGTTSLLVYPNKTGIACTVSPAPYFQTWFCCGGKDTNEFTYPNGKPVLKKNWDGMGIETGASPLDHNNIIDKTVDYNPVLKPGEATTNYIQIEFLEGEALDVLEKEIREYQK